MSDRRLLSTQLFTILKPILGLPNTARRIQITMDGPDTVATVEMEVIASTPLTTDEPPVDAGEFFLMPVHLDDATAEAVAGEVDSYFAEFCDGDTGSAAVVKAVHAALVYRNT